MNEYDDLEKLAIQEYYLMEEGRKLKEALIQHEHRHKAFQDLKGKLPGLTVDENNDCFYFAGRGCKAVERGHYYPGGQPAYCLEIERGEYISDLASFGEYLVRKNNGKRN